MGIWRWGEVIGMNTDKLIGMRVIEVNKKTIGIITNISNGLMSVDYYGQIVKYLYPSAFANYLDIFLESYAIDTVGFSKWLFKYCAYTWVAFETV